eukprot:gnl/Chilomastix_caulleri/486.p1 GENE.gnl/Chilomastix_caulleri/486~~gnl/Chilomastix_caulleri/486.p1  ORF type:complete len:115 (+),score=23.54 gnl/Chilomastix_caulleri/486:50-346(+)
MADVEETLKKLSAQKGIEGVVIINQDGIPIRSTIQDNEKTIQYAGVFSHLAMKARALVKELDPSEELTMIRIRHQKHEIIVTPERFFLLVVVQNPETE